MTYLSCLNGTDTPLVLDASVIINLNATGIARELISALNRPTFITCEVIMEVERGESFGYGDSTALRDLIAKKSVEVVDLSDMATTVFFDLASGSTATSLDDGEAATIAFSNDHSFCAVIDERKALRICAKSFPNLQTASTIDLLASEEILRDFPEGAIANAVVNALQKANMSVLPSQYQWTVDLIGHGRAANCCSLPQHLRASVST